MQHNDYYIVRDGIVEHEHRIESGPFYTKANPTPRFSEHNIVHVEGFTSHTSTGEVTGVDPGNPNFGETGFYCTVDFPDGEHQTFHEDELRLANDQELFVYLQGRDAEFVRKVLLQQPFSTGNRVTINKPGHPMHNLPGIVGSPYSDSPIYNVRLEDSSINGWFNTTELKHRLFFTAPDIDAILDAVSNLGMLEDYQMANLAEYLEDALRQKATRY